MPAGTVAWMAPGSTIASPPEKSQEHGIREQEMAILLYFKYICLHPAFLEVQHRSQFLRLALRALHVTEL